jgi:hypothetical protein
MSSQSVNNTMMPLSRIHPFVHLAVALWLVVGVQARTWTAADGSKTFEGELQSYDAASGKVGVTLSNGKRMTFTRDKLSADDIGWLEKNGGNPARTDQSTEIEDIKAYCLDFNWGGRRRFAKLGHKEGMLVMGYFCISANPKWAKDHPELSYGAPATYHIPYTDEYLAYLSAAISDVVKKTGIDGFMIDWLWQPKRQSTKGKWLDCEKKLYQQLMDEPFPGEDKLTPKQDLAYSRKAIDRCWKAIRKAAKDTNPDCIVWVTTNHMNHPHVVNSDMYKEADWLMNESGDMKRIHDVKSMVGKNTRLITCLALWNGKDATKVVPEAIKAGVGLYGFAKPRTADTGLVPLKGILSRPVSGLKGDDRNIAVLARAYHGVSIESVWNDKGEFEEPNK